MAGPAEWIAVDWGTSNVRAWGIDAAGVPVFSTSSEQGMGRLSREDYGAALEDLLDGQIIEADAEVIVCGMAGARQGWVEAPYLDAPADLLSLGFSAVSPDAQGPRTIRILPGICQKTVGAEDVMRGEETQLLGLAKSLGGYNGAVCMPGTHTKWATLDGTHLVRFTTAMTGELFHVLRTHSVLRHSLADAADGSELGEGFAAGAELGLGRPAELTSLLFKTRAASLLSGRGPDWCSGFLSGLLIGAEVGSHRDWLGSDVLPLIGSARLCAHYAEVLERIGVRSRVIDGADVTLRGLAAARAALLETGPGETR